jgi:hypothetical protein
MSNSTGLTSKLTSADGINYVNIGLMLLSLVAAYILPFELFLFSYAVLGPLHYLTEISWLEKKNYFVKSKKDIWVFIVLVTLITIGLFDAKSKINLFVGSFIFSGFVCAIIILYVEKLALKIALVLLTLILSTNFKVNDSPNFTLLFAIWLPTIIHVYFFTGAFILYGALKSRSTSGILSFIIFIACALIFFLFAPDNFGIPVTEYGKKAYSFFRIVNTSIYNTLGFGNLRIDDAALYFDSKAVAIMRFIAFAYTYHYLNWFSKTTVIKWNQISKSRMMVIAILWVISVILYLFSYTIGFYALFLLSMLHVFLEFPLNHHTFIGIGKEIRQIVKR